MPLRKQQGPNFIIGGTAAGGTSFLTAMLVQHPQIYLPKEMRPEPHYFYKSWEYARGLNYYIERWFAQVPSDSLAVGERSSSYLFGGRDVATKIAAVYPEMKFIFTLRNPIERTWANYRYTVLQGLEDLSFEEALSKEEQRIKEQSGVWAEIQPYNYTGRGFYGTQLQEYLEFFQKERMLLIKSEELSRNTRHELEKTYRFLDLTELDFLPERAPDHTSLSVVDPKLQMRLREHFAERFDLVAEAIRRGENISGFVQKTEDEEAIRLLRENMKGTKEPMPQECRDYLRGLFAKDMELLKSMVDFDISDWK